MDQEDKNILKKLVKLEEDNNRILHILLRAYRFNVAFQVLKWVIIIGSAVGLYYFFQPALQQFFEVYKNLGSIIQSPTSIFDSFQEGFNSSE